MKKIQWSMPFLLAATSVLALEGMEWLVLVGIAALLHECGHLLVLRLLGGRTEAVCFRLSGMDIRYSARQLSYGQDALLAAAGPAANLLCAVVCRHLSRFYPWEGLYLFTGVHLLLAIFNLLPALPLDGGRILQAALCSRFPQRGQRWTEGCSLAVALLLSAVGCFLFLKYSNFTLLVAAGVILFGLYRKKLYMPFKSR